MKEEITSKKKLIQSQKKIWQWRTRDFRFFYLTDFEKVSVSWVISIIFLFLINY